MDVSTLLVRASDPKEAMSTAVEAKGTCIRHTEEVIEERGETEEEGRDWHSPAKTKTTAQV